MMIATIIGARLGHVLFYEPEVYLANPIKILKIWEGGLASHGASIGILVALYLYSNFDIKMKLNADFPFLHFSSRKKKREGQSFLWVVDRIVIVVALTGCLIRLGNFMNSEIVGLPTNNDYGVVFARAAEQVIMESNPAVESVEAHKADGQKELNGHPEIELKIEFKDQNYAEKDVRGFLEGGVKRILTAYNYVTEHIYEPHNQSLNYQLEHSPNGYIATVRTYGIVRHPAQLYESISSILIFVLLFYIWSLKKEKTPEGQLFGVFLIVLFGLRIIYEFYKENQVPFEDALPLNMGQLLSIPFVLAGLFVLWKSSKGSSGNNQGTGS